MAIVKISDLPLVDSPVEGTDLFVVVQDNVTKKAYASDIQTYIGYDEVQTAAAGQTVFNLTEITYAPGSNNLMVFVDGVNQYVGTSYLETDSNTVTFTQGLHVGAQVKFSTVQTLSTVDTSAEDILFTQGGVGAVTRSVQSKLRETVSVKDFGAVGNGVADDTAAIQAALNSGAKQVFFPLGAYRTGPLILPNYAHIVGQTMPQGVGAGDGPVRLVFSLTSGNAITCGFNPVIENITFKNIGGSYNESTKTLTGTTASCIKVQDDVQVRDCNFYLWAVCIKLGNASYYTRFYNLEFVRSTAAFSSDTVGPYDVHIDSPTSRAVNVFFSGNSASPARNIKIFGGSIEGYEKIAENFLDLSLFGVYFETTPERAGAFAINPGQNGASVSIFGCLVYLNYTARFVNMGGLTGAMLCSSGNVFDGVAPASSVVFYLPASGTVNLSGDRFGSGHPNSCSYVDTFNFGGSLNLSSNIHVPTLPAANTQAAFSGALHMGVRGFLMPSLTAAPSAPPTGLTVLADGDSWDPLSRADGRPYWVLWQGDRWRTPGGLT
jgi:hypothetical protein